MRTSRLTRHPRRTPAALRTVRTVFISDVHLGTRGCQAELLSDFLFHHQAERIYLVGDIVEGSRLNGRRAWPKSHIELIQQLLAKARAGADVIYVLGNHDAVLGRFLGRQLGGVSVVREAIHECVDGRRYLVVHGDQFDVVIEYAPWLARLGELGYHGLLSMNDAVNAARQAVGLEYWSVSAWAKGRIKQVVGFIGRFEEKLSAEARRHRVHGVVCGHIHHAAEHMLSGVHYVNTGDWVESCTAVLERHDGRFELVRWRSSERS